MHLLETLWHVPMTSHHTPWACRLKDMPCKSCNIGYALEPVLRPRRASRSRAQAPSGWPPASSLRLDVPARRSRRHAEAAPSRGSNARRRIRRLTEPPRGSAAPRRARGLRFSSSTPTSTPSPLRRLRCSRSTTPPASPAATTPLATIAEASSRQVASFDFCKDDFLCFSC